MSNDFADSTGRLIDHIRTWSREREPASIHEVLHSLLKVGDNFDPFIGAHLEEIPDLLWVTIELVATDVIPETIKKPQRSIVIAVRASQEEVTRKHQIFYDDDFERLTREWTTPAYIHNRRLALPPGEVSAYSTTRFLTRIEAEAMAQGGISWVLLNEDNGPREYLAYSSNGWLAPMADPEPFWDERADHWRDRSYKLFVEWLTSEGKFAGMIVAEAYTAFSLQRDRQDGVVNCFAGFASPSGVTREAISRLRHFAGLFTDADVRRAVAGAVVEGPVDRFWLATASFFENGTKVPHDADWPAYLEHVEPRLTDALGDIKVWRGQYKKVWEAVKTITGRWATVRIGERPGAHSISVYGAYLLFLMGVAHHLRKGDRSDDLLSLDLAKEINWGNWRIGEGGGLAATERFARLIVRLGALLAVLKHDDQARGSSFRIGRPECRSSAVLIRLSLDTDGSDTNSNGLRRAVRESNGSDSGDKVADVLSELEAIATAYGGGIDVVKFGPKDPEDGAFLALIGSRPKERRRL